MLPAILSLACEHLLVSTNPVPATVFIIDSKWLLILSFDEEYNQLFGDDNLAIHRDGKAVHLTLNERTGSRFVPQDLYLHGYFSASIKLPAADYTAGFVVAFYMPNGDIFENYDEIGFESLVSRTPYVPVSTSAVEVVNLRSGSLGRNHAVLQ
ncbi:hypothetical protein V6N13_058133 [Hibiscus sabdariffa]